MAGHYNALRQKIGKSGDPKRGKRRQEEGQTQSELKVMAWNCRSIRDSLKRHVLINTIQIYEPHIITLMETFMISEDKLFIQNYQIFRADNDIKRKGVAILINKNVKANVRRL